MTDLIWKNGGFRILPTHSVRLVPRGTEQDVSRRTRMTNEGKRERLRALLSAAKPDLLLLGGDTLFVPTAKDEAAALLTDFLSPAQEAGVPWLFTFGEGERRTGLDAEILRAVFASVPGYAGMRFAGETDGITDGTAAVSKPDGEPALILRLFDTHAETTDYEKAYGSPGRSRLPYPLYSRFYMDGVRYNQTAWFDTDHDRLTELWGRHVPELFFFHTPTPEHAQLPLNQGQGGFDGVIREDGMCQTVNGGIAMAAAESGSVLGIICGHETENDWFAQWAGMTMGVEPSFENGAWVIGIRDPDSPSFKVERV
jgi:hypothetical protein